MASGTGRFIMRIANFAVGRPWLATLAAVAGLSVAVPASAEQGLRLERLGKVEFKVECNAAAQQQFNRAMALYHSFAWVPAAAAFEAVAKADPRCGMAHWGRAMVMLDNPFVWPVNLPPARVWVYRRA